MYAQCAQLLVLACDAECLHGHQERYDGMALPTIFPQPLMLAGTFDPQLAFEVRISGCCLKLWL